MAMKEISESIEIIKEILKLCDITKETLEHYKFEASGSMLHEALDKLIFAKMSKRSDYKQAKEFLSDMKPMMAELTDRLKKISEAIPEEYEFKDYGANEQFEKLHDYYKTTNIVKIKKYDINGDIGTIGGIDGKITKIMKDLLNLQK